MYYNILVEKCEWRSLPESPEGWGCELDSSGSRYGPVARSSEHGNEPSGSI